MKFIVDTNGCYHRVDLLALLTISPIADADQNKSLREEYRPKSEITLGGGKVVKSFLTAKQLAEHLEQ